MSNPITILDLALSRGVKQDPEGRISADEFYRVGLDIIGGCVSCGATIAAYNAYPSKSGYWKCADCIGDDGFYSVEEFNEWSKQRGGIGYHGTSQVYTIFRIEGQPSGLAVVNWETNDDNDDGIPDGEITTASWNYPSVEAALQFAGKTSHIGLYGQPVDVYLDGKKI